MNPVERLSRIEVKRAKLVSRVGVMDRELRLAHPRPGKWSIREIIEHLVIAEEAVLGEVTRLAELAARPRAIRHRVRFPVVMFILRFDIPVQAPSRAMLPSGELTFCDIRERWQTNHDGLRRYLGGSRTVKSEVPSSRIQSADR